MSVKLLDEADINEIEADAFKYVLTEEDVQWVRESSQMRLIATLRAEQEARQRAEAQRDRLSCALSFYRDGWVWHVGDIFVASYLLKTDMGSRARTALREIEGGEQ